MQFELEVKSIGMADKNGRIRLGARSGLDGWYSNEMEAIVPRESLTAFSIGQKVLITLEVQDAA